MLSVSRPAVACAVAVVVATIALLDSVAAEPADPPAPARPASPPDSGLVERVEVREVQVLVTAWPKAGDAARCTTLTKEDLTLEVDGKPTPIVSFLPYEEVVTEVPLVSVEAPKPLSIVILIDEFHHSCPTCAERISCCDGAPSVPGVPILRHAAYESARRMLRESFRPGDRVLVATFAFWPQAETGWLEDPAAALARLDELEQGMRWVKWEQGASQVSHWFPGMISFFRALGLVDGPKDVIFPTCHFQLGSEEAEEIRELSSVALENDVVLHTVDLMSCSLRASRETGSCESHEFVGPLAANLGGRRFSAGQGAAGAVTALRRVAGCRFLLTFKPKLGRRGRVGHSVSLSTRRAAEFDLHTPTTFSDPETGDRGPRGREAMFLMRELHRGYRVDAGLWPLRLASREEWESLAIVRIEREPASPPSATPEELVVEVIAWLDGERADEREYRLRGESLAALLAGSAGQTFAVPLRVRPGENNLSVIVHDPASKEGAVRRRRVPVPALSLAERGRWWIPAGRDARLDGEVIPTPTGSGVFGTSEVPRLLGLACGAAEATEESERHCVNEVSGASVPLEVRGLGATSPRVAPPPNCRWLIAEPLAPLPPGRWLCGEGAPVLEIVESPF